MKKRIFKKVVCGILTAVMLATSMSASVILNTVEADEVSSDLGLLTHDHNVTVDGNDIIVSSQEKEGTFLIKDAEGNLHIDNYEKIKASFDVTCDIQGMTMTPKCSTREINGETIYNARILWELDNVSIGTIGSFTVKFDGFEETYTVKVVDYENTISEVLLDGFEPQYDEEGNILFEIDLSSEGTFQDLYFRNLKGQRLEVGDGSYDASKISIDGFVNAQEDISWSSDKDDLAVDTVVGLTLGESLTKEGMLSVTIFPTRTGEAYFNVNYGDFTQRVHVVVGNLNNLPADIQLDKYELTVSTGEKVTINAYNYPENAYHDGGEWLVTGIDESSNTLNSYRMDRNDDVAEIVFYKPGVYTVQNVKFYDSDRYMWGVKKFYSSICMVTVIGEALDSPTGNDRFNGKLDDSITPSPRPTETPVPTESIAPTETPIATETVAPIETPVPTGTEKTTDVPTVKYLFGDVDFNGRVSSKDALAVLKHSACLESLDGISLKLADISEDGNIDAKDALIILKIAAALEDEKFIEIK